LNAHFNKKNSPFTPGKGGQEDRLLDTSIIIGAFFAGTLLISQREGAARFIGLRQVYAQTLVQEFYCGPDRRSGGSFTAAWLLIEHV
jgi:hypothetical protein